MVSINIVKHIREEIYSLIIALENRLPQPGSVEDKTLNHLRLISSVAATAHRAAELNADFSALRQYWLTSIDWCSQLSRDVEKLLIIQEEQVAEDG